MPGGRLAGAERLQVMLGRVEWFGEEGGKGWRLVSLQGLRRSATREG